MADSKTCYLIGPIGEPKSSQRQWADFLRDNVIDPAVTACGYEKPARADDPHTDSMIMPGVVAQMFEADLVVADLTGDNPNVYYELGIRHCARKRVVHLKRTGEKIPFDLGGNKAIPVDESYLGVTKAIEDITTRIKAIEANPNEYFSHVHQYLALKQLDVQDKQAATFGENIGNVLSSLATQMTQIAESQREISHLLAEKQGPLLSFGDASSHSWSSQIPIPRVPHVGPGGRLSS
jgi:hypothetical protein